MKKIIGWLCVLVLLVGCGGNHNSSSENATKEQVRVMLDWVPNTNHMGLYVAQALGYFDQAGIDVFILQPPEDGGLDFLLTGKADVLVSGESSLYFGRDRGMDLVAIAAILQQNDSALVALPDSGITRPRDLFGKRYLSYGGANDLQVIRALMAKDGVEQPEVTLAMTGAMADLNALLHGEGDYVWLFRGWDILAAKLAGIELNEILLRDFDEAFNYYTPMYVSTDAIIDQRKESLSAFAQALARGYEYAAQYPLEASRVFIEQVPGMDKALIEASTQHLASLYVNEQGRFGLMDASVFERYLAWSIEHNLLPNNGNNIRVHELFTNSLLLGE